MFQRNRLALPITLITAAMLVRGALHAAPLAKVDLISVQPPDPKRAYEKADDWLRKYLSRRLEDPQSQLKIEPVTFMEYGKAIDEVISRTEHRQPFLARMTPYAYVAATMLGAKVDVIGTYESRATSGNLTYRSYFVVNKSDFDKKDSDGQQRKPTLDGLADYSRQHSTATTRPTFLYYDRMSTSSYFLPALWLRGQRMFEKAATDDFLTAIATEQTASSTESVKAVAATVTGARKFAAVWDGTKNTFDRQSPLFDSALQQYADEVRFLQLPTELPNDLLVVSTNLEKQLKEKLVRIVESMKEDFKTPKGLDGVSREIPGDFIVWRGMRDAAPAKQALAALLQRAAEPPAPVVVDAEVLPSPGEEALKEALVKAVRLARPEFVLFDDDYYDGRWDMKWTLERVKHDNALRLTVSIRGTSIHEQYPISFVDASGDLTSRITAIVRSRVPRIRYLWPYESTPTILGDLEFTPDNKPLKVDRITWVDPEHNKYSNDGGQIDAQIENANLYRYQLKWAPGPLTSGFDNPLSNTAYRVVLEPPSDRNGVAGPVVLATVGSLMIFAAVGLFLDLRRRPATVAAVQSFEDVATDIVCHVHDVWAERELADASVLWCSRHQIDSTIEELKARNIISDRVGLKRVITGTTFGLNVPLPQGALAKFERSRSIAFEANPQLFGDTARLGALLDLLIRHRQLSPLVWPPIEWDALNSFVAPGLHVNAGDAGATPDILKRDSGPVLRAVSSHFSGVVEESLQKISFFRARWVRVKADDRSVATSLFQVPEGLRVGRDSTLVKAISLAFDVPSDVDRTLSSASGSFECWMLAKIRNMAHVDESGVQVLKLAFSPIALLSDPAE